MTWVKTDREEIIKLISINNSGLFYGNTALCLFHGLKEYGSINDIIQRETPRLRDKKNDLSLSTGIPGIAIVLDYLSYHHTGHHMSELLKEVDSILYHRSGYDMTTADIDTFIDTSIYLYYRLNHTCLSDQERKLWLSVLAKSNDRILNLSFPSINRDPYFSIKYKPGITLLCLYLGLISGLDSAIWTKKINVFCPYIFDTTPQSPSNRLYLYLILKNIRDTLHIYNSALNRYLDALYCSIHLSDIKTELRDKIYVNDGICGLYLLCHFLDKDDCFRSQLKNIVSDVKFSSELKRLNTIKPYKHTHIGLLNGIGGILLAELLLKKSKFTR